MRAQPVKTANQGAAEGPGARTEENGGQASRLTLFRNVVLQRETFSLGNPPTSSLLFLASLVLWGIELWEYYPLPRVPLVPELLISHTLEPDS